MSCRRSGFTLIELVASAVLSTMLMVALMSIVWSVMRDTSKLRADEINLAPITILADQLRLDFHNARGMQVDANAITLHGFLGRDASTSRPTLLPATVRYEVMPLAERTTLVRTAQSTREVVWFGFGAINILPLAESEAGDSLPIQETGGLPAVPAQFRVTLTAETGQVLWREVIDHHAG